MPRICFPTLVPKVVPQWRQNQSLTVGIASKQLKSCSPWAQTKLPGFTTPFAEAAPLNALRQREQWQASACTNGALIA
jgi:hypothetical protein